MKNAAIRPSSVDPPNLEAMKRRRKIKPDLDDPVVKYEVNRYEGSDWTIETYLIPSEWIHRRGQDSHFVVLCVKETLDKDFREIVMDGDEFEALAKFFKEEAKNNRNRIWTVE